MRLISVRRVLFAASLALTIVVLWSKTTSPAMGAEAEKPGIEFTSEVKDGSGGENPREDLAGKSHGPEIAKCKVVIYVKTDKWYVQPYEDKALTDIDEKGEWKVSSSLGHKYAALLVKDSFKAAATLDKLPEVGGDVLAIVE